MARAKGKMVGFSGSLGVIAKEGGKAFGVNKSKSTAAKRTVKKLLKARKAQQKLKLLKLRKFSKKRKTIY